MPSLLAIALLLLTTSAALAWPEERSSSDRPTPQQLAWQDLEYGMFCHFSINTFNDLEWSDGTLDPKTFNPTEFDVRQWVSIAKECGMKYLILTAKHHDGFCTWPTQQTDYSVQRSPWRGGKGDVVGEVARACHEAGLKFGFYLSPWDRHEPRYADNKAYDEYFQAQLRELLTNYGEVMEVWFDGAGGQGHVYDWDGYYRTVKQLQPNALQAIAGSADIRWVGNENGVAPDTCWNVLQVNGKPYWWPAECDVPIRGNWFWHTNDLHTLKSVEQLVDIYHQAVGHGAGLLLNVAPDRRGLIPEPDAQRLREVWQVITNTYAHNLLRSKPVTASSQPGRGHGPAKAVDGKLGTYWAAKPDETDAWLEVSLGEPTTFDRVVVQEWLALGERVKGYRLEAWDGQQWRQVCSGESIGHKKIAVFEPVTAARLRLHLHAPQGGPTVREFGAYSPLSP